jgi:hypothetical protein
LDVLSWENKIWIFCSWCDALWLSDQPDTDQNIHLKTRRETIRFFGV